MRDMKESGVAWLGTIPKEYKTVPIGSLFTIKKDIIGQEPDTVLSITQTGVKPKDLSSNEGQNASSYAHYQKVCVGDFAMNHMDLLTGWVDISKYEGVTSPDYRVFSMNDESQSADFFLRVFQYYYANKIFFGFGQGVATLGRWRLPAVNFQKIDVPVPPPSEQKRIVKAINAKVEKIEELKQNVKDQIDKLRLYKQSLITEIITKGLNSSAPTIDSGISWIGSIPEHWKLCRIKNLADQSIPDSFIDGDWIESPYITDEGIRYLTTGNVGDGSFKRQGEGYITQDTFVDLNCKYAYPGDLVISRLNSPYGRACILPNDEEKYVLAVDIVILRTKFNKRYICYYTQCPGYQRTVEDLARGTAMKRISRTNLGSIPILLPPIEEQDAIADYLDKRCETIDALISIKQTKIEKLDQYKKSIIYEYVTGKKEVQ